jgi:holo-[acyl-carrier protein] synthase
MTISGTFSWSDVAAPGGAAAGVIRAGVDRVELDEFRHTLDVVGKRFLERVYTPVEIGFCAGRVERLATRFAAKEAAAKVFGTGFRGLGWREIEVLSSPHGEPHLILHHRARDLADRLGITSISLSLTHTAVAAEAFVVALCISPDAEQCIREETRPG